MHSSSSSLQSVCGDTQRIPLFRRHLSSAYCCTLIHLLRLLHPVWSFSVFLHHLSILLCLPLKLSCVSVCVCLCVGVYSLLKPTSVVSFQWTQLPYRFGSATLYMV